MVNFARTSAHLDSTAQAAASDLSRFALQGAQIVVEEREKKNVPLFCISTICVSVCP